MDNKNIKINFASTISFALLYVKKIIFHPFNLRKVFIIAIIATLAGGFGGFNFNWTRSLNNTNKHRAITTKAEYDSTGKEKKFYAVINGREEPICSIKRGSSITFSPKAITFITLFTMIIISLGILFLWLKCRFIFVFLHSTINDSLSIAAPFHAYKKEGNNLFILYLLLNISLMAIGAICASPLFFAILKAQTANIVLSFAPMTILAIVAFAIILLFYILVFILIDDFAVPIIFTEHTNTIQGIKKSLSIFSTQKINFLLYLIYKAILNILSAVIFALITLTAIIAFALLAVAAGIIIYGISNLGFLAAYKTQLIILYFMAAILPLLVVLILFILIASAPFSLFFRTFSLKILEASCNDYKYFSATEQNSCQ